MSIRAFWELLRRHYLNGNGVEEDKEEAAKWFKEAAEQGDLEAQNMLGRCYYEGWGVETDYEKAAEWYLKAAEQEYTVAQYNLGICYDSWWWHCGVGPTAAIPWMQKAARNGLEEAQKWLKDRGYNW